METTPESAQRLKALLTKENITILLVIDDPDSVQDAIVRACKDIFPGASVYSFQGYGVDEHPIEELVERRYDLVLIDGSLSKWKPHPTFGGVGHEVIPFIREISPATAVVSVSNADYLGEIALEKGADLALPKGDLYELIDVINNL